MYRQGAPISIGNVTLPNVVSAPGPAAPPAPVNGLVHCSLHKKNRAIKFVQTKAITNAEGAVVGYTYHCIDSSPCIVGPPAGSSTTAEIAPKEKDDEDFDIDGPSQESADGLPPQTVMKRLGYDGVRTTTTGSPTIAAGLFAQTGGVIPKGLFEGDGDNSGVTSPTTMNGRFTVGGGNAAGRGPSRYYDMNKVGRGDDNKKVCWSCGMDSHEKPQCPNLLCRNCHDGQEAGYEGRMNHKCSRVGLSAFVLLDTDFLDNFMAAEEIKIHNAAQHAPPSSPDSAAAHPNKSNPLLTFDEAAFVNPSLLTTRCPRCNQLGHMDCPHPLSAHVIKRGKANAKRKGTTEDEANGIQRQLSCCGCASSDHSGYECPSRPRDYWRERVINLAGDKMGMTAVRKIVAVDERAPQPSRNSSNTAAIGGNSYGGSNSSFNNNNNASSGGRNNNVNRSNSGNYNNNNQRRGRDDDGSDGWSEEDRAFRRGGRRGEYDSGYNRAASGGKNARRGAFSDDDDYSYDDSYDDSDGDGGGRSGGRGRGGRRPLSRAANHTFHQGRLDSQDFNDRRNDYTYSRNNSNNSSSFSNKGSANTSYRAGPQSPRFSSNATPPSSYRTPHTVPQQQYQQQFNFRSAPQQQEHRSGNSYSRPPPPPPNSQPGRGAYSRRGFEF